MEWVKRLICYYRHDWYYHRPHWADDKNTYRVCHKCDTKIKA